MKTTILDELELPEAAREALSREALRQGKPVKQLIREKLLALTEQVLAAAQQPLSKAA